MYRFTFTVPSVNEVMAVSSYAVDDVASSLFIHDDTRLITDIRIALRLRGLIIRVTIIQRKISHKGTNKS